MHFIPTRYIMLKTSGRELSFSGNLRYVIYYLSVLTNLSQNISLNEKHDHRICEIEWIAK